MKVINADELLTSLNHPQHVLIFQLREIIKQASPVLVEGVKWNAPSYALNGNDILTFNFHNHDDVSLIFHTGPKGKDTKTGKVLFEEASGLITWIADKRAVLKVKDVDFLAHHSEDIVHLVQLWVTYAKNNFEIEKTG
jgi:hypothetical protein